RMLRPCSRHFSTRATSSQIQLRRVRTACGLQPWRAEDLTLGAEIDKLAANIALARDAAGVHFRSDSIRGLKLGEEVAIGLLADTSRIYNEKFDGFVLSRFDGSRIRISDGAVHAL